MLQFITHPSERYSIEEQVRLAIEGGCRWVQLRMKDATDEEVADMARRLTPMCQESKTILVVDDRVQVVMDTRVSGVHLGAEDMPPQQAREFLGPHAIIGCTAHSAEEILALRGLDVDYVGLGPYRFTATKQKLAPVLGLEGIRDIIARVRAQGFDLPIVAIGGITADDVDPLLDAGADGIALSGAILAAPDPAAYVRQVLG